MKAFLSKSKYLSGLQCSKLLWHQYRHPEEISEYDDATQANFDEGHEVGRLAQGLFPGGVEVEWLDGDFAGSIARTQDILRERKPIYEASFLADNAYARADILVPAKNDAWDIVEVKKTSSVKDVHIEDLAFQRHCYEAAGLKIARCFLCHLNGNYVRGKELKIKKLFQVEDVSEAVATKIGAVPSRIGQMLSIIAEAKCPGSQIGTHCSDPYECPLYEKCHEFLPKHNPLTLFRLRKQTAYDLIHKGILEILAITGKDCELTENQLLQRAAISTGQPVIDTMNLAIFLRKLQYPLYFLDFETMGPAIPLFEDSRPYQQIPFQFSLHIRETPGGKATHHSFLAEAGADPRPLFMETLRPLLGDSGNIVAYNASFETSRLAEMAEFLPQYHTWVRSLDIRIIDLLVPFRKFHYHHPGQCGSNSIKKVLPPLIGKSYEGMEIADGGTASLEYLRTHFGAEVATGERQRVRNALESYCRLDTQAMIDILDALQVLVPKRLLK